MGQGGPKRERRPFLGFSRGGKHTEQPGLSPVRRNNFSGLRVYRQTPAAGHMLVGCTSPPEDKRRAENTWLWCSVGSRFLTDMEGAAPGPVLYHL